MQMAACDIEMENCEQERINLLYFHSVCVHHTSGLAFERACIVSFISLVYCCTYIKAINLNNKKCFTNKRLLKRTQYEEFTSILNRLLKRLIVIQVKVRT